MVALNAVCAVVWGILAIMDVAARNEIQILIMHAFCAVIWLTASVLNFIRYKKEKHQDNDVF
jgi:type VI protein secretion system component VasK